jgi:hypothetical protein
MNEWFVIKNLEEFTDKARIIVYNNFGQWENEDQIDDIIDYVKESDEEDLNKVLSLEESLVIVKQNVKKQKNKKNKKIRYVLSTNLFSKIVEDLNARLVSNVLNQLVQKGLVESGYDSESNDFIFWVKNENSTNEKPETD